MAYRSHRSWRIGHLYVSRFYEAALLSLGAETLVRIARDSEPLGEKAPDLGGVGFGVDYPTFWIVPEIELFDSGDCHLASDLIAGGTLAAPSLFSLVLGVKYGFNATPETMIYARGLLPEWAVWTGFGIGRAEFPMVAQAWLLGGHVRVGMEDNLYLAKGVLAESNAALVARAVDILRGVGAAPATPIEARAALGLS